MNTLYLSMENGTIVVAEKSSEGSASSDNSQTNTQYVSLENSTAEESTPSDDFSDNFSDNSSDVVLNVNISNDRTTNGLHTCGVACDSTLAPSIVSTVMTKEELHDTTGFSIVCWMLFLADMSRGVVFPTMWPLIESLGGNEVDLGYAVAAYSVGRAICAPIYGKGSIRYGYTNTLLLSTAVLLIGAFLYAQAPNVGTPGFVVFSQILLGIGSGTLGVCRAYTAEVTAHRVRTTYLAWLSAVQYFGFSVTPLLGSAMTVFFEMDGRVIDNGFFLLNAFTAPGYFLCLTSVVTLALLMVFFKDKRRSKPAPGGRKSQKRKSIEEVANTKCFLGISTHTACVIGCMYLNFVIKGTISCFETLGIQIAESSFGISSSYAGTIVSICGAIGVFELLMMRHISKILSDVQMICGGMASVVVGLACFVGLSEDGNNEGWLFCLSMFMVYGAGYSVCQASILGLFSKVIGRVPQGELMGLFAIAGAVPRILYPLMSGYIVYHSTVSLLSIILISTLAISILYVLINRREFSHLSQ